MPLYDYQCLDCGSCDLRVAGLDDHMAICSQCGSLMLRMDEDLFRPYFEKESEQIRADREFLSFPDDRGPDF